MKAMFVAASPFDTAVCRVLASPSMSNHTRILIGLVLGAVAGVVTNIVTDGGEATARFVSNFTEPAGRMWLSALVMVVIPLVLCSLALGVAEVGDLKKVGRLGLITFVIFVAFTTLSALIGLTLMNTIRPGGGLDPSVRAELMEVYAGEAQNASTMADKTGLSVDLLVKIIPRNPIKAAADGDMLAVVFFSLMIGLGIASLPREKTQGLVSFLEGLGLVVVEIIHLVMKLAPLGVFCLVFSVTARFGFDIIVHLSKYIGMVIFGLALMMTLVYGLALKLVAKRNPFDFIRRSRVVIMTAFSTSSSSATLPTAIDVARTELGISDKIAGFILPLGATMNQHGTSLFEGATVLFLAQVFGIELSLGQQVMIVAMSVVTAIGTAGVPGGSIPFVIMLLGMVGVPMEGIAIVLGVDRILDMCRTTVNVEGDLVTAAIVDRMERDAA